MGQGLSGQHEDAPTRSGHEHAINALHHRLMTHTQLAESLLRLKLIPALMACLLAAACTTADKPATDALPFKKNALIVYSDRGSPIQDALEPLCRAVGKGDASKQSKLGVAIVAGMGFNYAYEDPRASEAVLYMARKYAEALQEEIKRCGVAAEVHMNASKATPTREHVAQTLAKRKSDGLIQVSIAPERVGDGTDLFISTDYFVLTWEGRAQGASVTTGAGPAQKHKVASDAPLALYARRFATALRDQGYIGR